MLLYRVFPYLSSAALATQGHPVYEHLPQRNGRIDHPDYFVWYLARTAAGAIGETFGNVGQWQDSMFAFPAIPGSRRALGMYWLPDDIRLLDLDDGAALGERSLRPTHIVIRNLPVTQRWGHQIWDERDPHDPTAHRWEAVEWWSFHRPLWKVIASWQRPEFREVEELTLDHPAIRDAASSLSRVLPTI